MIQKKRNSINSFQLLLAVSKIKNKHPLFNHAKTITVKKQITQILIFSSIR